MTEDEFRASLPTGFGPARPKRYEPLQKPGLHAHDFDARVLITGGELHMVFEDRTEILGPGDTCVVPAGTLHSETCTDRGADGLLATTAPD
jgi:quercetin dioxygenase-like cupin family protein